MRNSGVGENEAVAGNRGAGSYCPFLVAALRFVVCLGWSNVFIKPKWAGVIMQESWFLPSQLPCAL